MNDARYSMVLAGFALAIGGLAIGGILMPGVVPFWLGGIALPIAGVAFMWRASTYSWRSILSWAAPSCAVLLIADGVLPFPANAIVVMLVFLLFTGLATSERVVSRWFALVRLER